jgi:uncharacterized protein YbjT (DUF2867 family)
MVTKPLILVTAATGKTGSAIVHELLARCERVRALVHRRDARSEALARAGAQIVPADMFDAGQMAAAMRGVQRAHYTPPFHPHTAQTLAAFLHAAEVNRIEAVTAMTQWLASPSHPALMTRDMWAVEQALPRLRGAAVTILNPGFFADNYLRTGFGMAAQLGLYANFLGDSRNAPPSNADMGRVAAAILADPARHDGQRYRITGPALIGVAEITAAFSAVLGRRVRAIPAPGWLLDKVAAWRGEPAYDVAAFQHYLEDHRQGAFAFGGPTSVVEQVTGRPAESFETTVRSYAARPEARRTARGFIAALGEFMLAPLWPGHDTARLERRLAIPDSGKPLYAMQDEAWKAARLAQPGGPRAMPPIAAAA